MPGWKGLLSTCPWKCCVLVCPSLVTGCPLTCPWLCTKAWQSCPRMALWPPLPGSLVLQPGHSCLGCWRIAPALHPCRVDVGPQESCGCRRLVLSVLTARDTRRPRVGVPWSVYCVPCTYHIHSCKCTPASTHPVASPASLPSCSFCCHGWSWRLQGARRHQHGGTGSGVLEHLGTQSTPRLGSRGPSGGGLRPEGEAARMAD